MAERLKHNHQIDLDPAKQDNIDYLFNSNPLYNQHHYRKLNQKQPKHEDAKQDSINDITPPKHIISEDKNAKMIENTRPNYKKELGIAQKHTNERVHLHSQSFMFVFLTVIACQMLIYFWKRKHPRSFFIATLLGLWIFPIIMSVQLHYWRMICIWFIFSIIFGFILNMSRQKPMNRKTPRYLYSWFYLLHKITNYLSIIGYMLFLADFFGFGVLVFGPHPKEERAYRSKLMHHQHEQQLHAMHGDQMVEWVKEDMLHEQEELAELAHGYHHIHFSDIGLYMLFYGLYYGVLARDTAQLCADWISSALGFFNPSGFPRRRVPDNICAVCNNPLIDHNIGLFDSNNEQEWTPNDKDSTTDRRMKLMKQRRRMEEKTAAAEMARKSKGFPMNCCSFTNTKQDEEVVINCKHRFHGFCIRGWIMIGKRDVCPVCKEKVNLKGIFANPWHKQDRMWSQLLDGVRYLLVWNPVIVLAANVVFTVTGMSFTSKNKQTPLADH
eukprot:152689_1